jgi:hypothetical protein
MMPVFLFGVVHWQLSGRFLARSRILSKKACGGDADQGSVAPQYNATHINSIPGNWLIGGDLAALMTAERHFPLDVQSRPGCLAPRIRPDNRHARGAE